MAGVSELAIHDENTARREALIQRLNSLNLGHVKGGTSRSEWLRHRHQRHASWHERERPLPIDLDAITPNMFIGCVITAPAVPPLIAAARAKGCNTTTGADMFVQVRELMVQFLLEPIDIMSTCPCQTDRSHRHRSLTIQRPRQRRPGRHWIWRAAGFSAALNAADLRRSRFVSRTHGTCGGHHRFVRLDWHGFQGHGAGLTVNPEDTPRARRNFFEQCRGRPVRPEALRKPSSTTARRPSPILEDHTCIAIPSAPAAS
jgi:hypothetical protein